MASTKPEIEWEYNPRLYWREYGLICLAGKWAVVKAREKYSYVDEDYDVITDWVDRPTAVGFLKLLREKV